MQIDSLNVALRARNPWEALDLGVALARYTGLQLYLAFALPYLGFALLVNLATWGSPTLAICITWWCKPIFDRVALAVVSQAVFSDTPDWRTTLRGLARIPRTGLVHALFFDRFDMARSFHLAVSQLEGQHGRARRLRIRLLDRQVRYAAVWLTVVMVQFAYVLLTGLDGLIKMFLPDGTHFSINFGHFFSLFSAPQSALASHYLFNTVFALAECVLEPIYVAAGFTLYLSRRTALEGWDLEVAFKRLTARHKTSVQAAGNTVKKAAVVLLAAVLGQALSSDDALAQARGDAPLAATTVTAAPAAAAPSAEKRMIEDILKQPEFRQYEEQKVWRRKSPLQAERRATMPLGDGWTVFARFLSEVLRAAAWAAAIVVAGWLLYHLAQRLDWFKDLGGKRIRHKPEVLFGLDLRPESLPDDVAAAARGLLAQDDYRAALSLLYRGALRVLIHQRDLPLGEGDTEGDCVRQVTRTESPALAAYFRRLVEAWGQVAYARRAPAPALAQQLAEEWTGHFAGPTVSVSSATPATPAVAGPAERAA